jgi:hypothetical protein
MYVWKVLDFHLPICFISASVLPNYVAAPILKEWVLYWPGLYPAKRNADFKMEQMWKRVTTL